MHWVERAAPLALPKAGNSSAARIAMMVMTTNNSMRVKARMEAGGLFTEGNEDNEARGETGGVRLKGAVREPAVAQICNLLYRGFPIRTALKAPVFAPCSVACRMQFGDTAD